MEQLEELFVHQTALDRLDLSQAKNQALYEYDSQIHSTADSFTAKLRSLRSIFQGLVQRLKKRMLSTRHGHTEMNG